MDGFDLGQIDDYEFFYIDLAELIENSKSERSYTYGTD